MAGEREESEEERLARWFAARPDYSWEALAGHEIEHGTIHGDQTLQDYWRRDPATGQRRDDSAMVAAGELIWVPAGTPWLAEYPAIVTNAVSDAAPPEGATSPGAWFHIAHAPMTVKGEDALAEVIAARFGEGQTNETKVDWMAAAQGPDCRAQLAGAMLSRAPGHPEGKECPLHLAARFALFAKADFDGQCFGPGACFVSATFQGDASFIVAAFQGDARFESATFQGDARFDAATFKGTASFDRATFQGVATFDTATFQGYASFRSATFQGDAGFIGATFQGDASFDSAAFQKNADFAGAAFQGGAGFDSATFKKTLWMRVEAFEKRADFRTAIFDGLVYFDCAPFRGDIDFTAAKFMQLASFENITWPTHEAHWRSAFERVLFHNTAVFTGAGCTALAAFDGATFERGISIDGGDEKPIAKQFKAELKAAKDAPEATRENDQGQERTIPAAVERADALRALESGARVLKKAMAYENDNLRGQMFYRFELLARRAQKGVPWTEKAFSFLFDWTANFGASIGRPFLALGAVVALFALGYWAIAAGLGDVGKGLAAFPAGAFSAIPWVAPPAYPVDPDWRAALEFSFSRVFPFGAFEDVSKTWLAALEPERDGLLTLFVRILGSIQSAFALALVFVFGLAVRRKFQMG